LSLYWMYGNPPLPFPLVPSALRFILQGTSLYSSALMQPCCSHKSESHVIAFAIDKHAQLLVIGQRTWRGIHQQIVSEKSRESRV